VRTKKKIYALLNAAGRQRLAVTELPSRASSPRPLRMPGRRSPLGRPRAGHLPFGPIRRGQITATGADSMERQGGLPMGAETFRRGPAVLRFRAAAPLQVELDGSCNERR
ncbi:MAG: hypothetical protein ACK6DS_05385, partial [Planctomycetota bacterium]